MGVDPGVEDRGFWFEARGGGKIVFCVVVIDLGAVVGGLSGGLIVVMVL